MGETSLRIRAVPDEFIGLVNSGQATVYGSIIKRNTTGKIIAHLEQVGNIGINEILNPISPGLKQVGNTVITEILGSVLSKDVFSLVGIAQNLKIMKQLDNLTDVINNVQILSWVNIGLNGVNLGISTIGFILINNKLNDISEQLRNLDKKIKCITVGVDSLIRNEKSKLIESAINFIDKATLNIAEIHSKGINDVLSQCIRNDLIEMKSFLFKVTDLYATNYIISIEIETIISVYLAYINLAKAYIIAKRFNDENIDLLNDIFKMEQILERMGSKEILDFIYQKYVFDRERLYSENEIDSIINVYKLICEKNFEIYDSQYQLLNSISTHDLIDVDNKLKNIEIGDEKFVFVEWE